MRAEAILSAVCVHGGMNTTAHGYSKLSVQKDSFLFCRKYALITVCIICSQEGDMFDCTGFKSCTSPICQLTHFSFLCAVTRWWMHVCHHREQGPSCRSTICYKKGIMLIIDCNMTGVWKTGER
ncbi:hypothetical protein AMECASPLE_035712 [Ameca splendens]|uniref:Uncharacterized protein n=1 Tax=Ameca splendens TaxID=208324 RepID=A0ABV0YVF9_9TELE